MADRKISQLNDGVSFQPGDEAVVNRSGANFKVDPTQFSGFDLTAISTTIADTAVDVFVYDTSRDSDGGAWRHRTQHTSWYNETLNTATRGSRREFPAVAVIVAESNQVTIYDGDDPSLPMWMVFETGGSKFIVNTPLSSASFLNGVLCVGGLHLTKIDFLADFASRYLGRLDYFVGGVADRNDSSSYIADSGGGIVATGVNDVAMTVLPNAPIDAATGLPVPTIAVATAGGVSVIKDDGTVVDLIYSSNSATTVAWLENYNVGVSFLIGGTNYVYRIFDSIAADTSSQRSSYAASTTPAILGFNNSGNEDISSGLDYKGDVVIGSGTEGFTLIKEDLNTQANGMVAYTTSTYNTGWMNGDIKLATLSDTDDTDVTGSELVTNGTFDTDITGWTPHGDGATTNTWNAGGYMDVSAATPFDGTKQTINTVSGETYVLSADVTLGTATTYSLLANTANVRGIDANSITFVASGSTEEIRIDSYSSAGTFSVDNVSVRLAELDRSVNGNGLQVYGTITKDPVSSGADLVAYSGFSAANYLEQPYNSDLDFGTGDFCMMGWVKTSGTTTQTIFDLADLGRTGQTIFLGTFNGDFSYRIGSATTVNASAYAENVWIHVALLRSNGVAYLYVNGVLDDTVAASDDLSNPSAVLYVGLRNDVTRVWVGSLALLRISATAPTAEQVAKIYEDEKFLFQENSQATLYGSSDAVTALAHDEVTDLLHVGTSAGRSVFQGLRRVDNTTDAVGVAISAYDDLVVED